MRMDKPDRGSALGAARTREMPNVLLRLPRPIRERAALRWLERFIEERLPSLTKVALAGSALTELRHGHRNVGVEALKRLLRRG
jgi:hypothetical protein